MHGRDCEVCGRPILTAGGRGRPRKTHPECSARPARDLNAEAELRELREMDDPTRKAIRGAHAAKAHAQLRAAAVSNVARRVTDARKIAVALRVYPGNPEEAGRLAGVLATGDDLVELLARANSEDHRGLREGSSEATTQTVSVAVSLLAEAILASVHELPAASLPMALRLASQVAEEMGGMNPIPTTVNVIYEFEGDDDVP